MAPPSRLRLRRSALALLVGSCGLLALGSTAAPGRAAVNGPGEKGAQVYCFMRNNGNSHEISWAAAYALIKRQSAGLFKTSPEHAAVMITETVVNDPAAFPDCGRYIGDLYSRKVPTAAAKMEPVPVQGSTSSTPGPMTRSERYGY